MNVSRKVKRWFSFTMVSIFPGTKLELRQESWGPDRIQIFDFTRVPCGWITELRRDSWGQRRGLILCTARISNTELYNFRTYFRCGFCVIGYNRSAHIIFFLDKASCKLLEQYMLYAILVQCFFQNETYSTVFISIYYDKCCITSTWVFFSGQIKTQIDFCSTV